MDDHDRPTKPPPRRGPEEPTLVAGVAASVRAAADRYESRKGRHDLAASPQVAGRDAIVARTRAALQVAEEAIAAEAREVLNAVGLALYNEGVERGKLLARDVVAGYLAALEAQVAAAPGALALPRPTAAALAAELLRRRLPVSLSDVRKLCCDLALHLEDP